VSGDTTIVPDDTTPVLRAGRFEIRAVPDGASRNCQGEIYCGRNVFRETFGSI
jgi:hypothetical protein